MKKTLLICLALYSLTLGILLFNALTNGIISDRTIEYTEYVSIIERGGWTETPDNIVSSSLFATYIPARIHLLTGWDAVTLFKIFPCFFFALVPCFSFLIARRYMNDKLAVLCALFMLSQFNMLHNSNLGRVSIGFGVFAVYAWAMLSRRYLILIITGAALILAHYGSASIAAFIGAVTLLGLIIQYRLKIKEYWELAVIGCCLLVAVGAWYFGFAGTTGNYIKSFVGNIIAPSQLSFPISFESGDDTLTITEHPEYTIEIAKEQQYELTLQYAFAQNWGEMNYYQKIEWFICWTIILALIGGIILAVRKKVLQREHLFMTLACLVVIMVPILNAWTSTHYGIGRVYITALMVIAPFFIYGLVKLSEKININKYILPSVLIGLNALIVTGVSPPYLWGLIE